MDIRFTSQFPTSQINEIVDLVIKPRLWVPNPQIIYPDIYDWAQKVYVELFRQEKFCIVAVSGIYQIAGLIIFQQHKKYQDALEIKHLNVLPQMQNRYIASFLLRNAEVEGKKLFPHLTKCLCDAKAENRIVFNFLLKHHYLPKAKLDLYDLKSGEDIIYEKMIC